VVVEHIVVVVEESVAVVSSEFPTSRMTATTVAARDGDGADDLARSPRHGDCL